ncbi:MAG: hypothetical protein IH987_01150 [Planctomycetes bacterium]|nr:hypothetical protein [Planctomycetota bacterium]
MDTLGWLLTNLAEGLGWLWGALVAVFSLAYAVLNTVLNPVLSFVLRLLSPVCTVIGDGVYALLSPLPIWAGLVLLSAVAGVVMLVAFGRLSNQEGIVRAKDDIKANLLSLKLYKDNLRATFTAQMRLMGAIVRLQRHMLFPVLILSLPMLLALAQMGIRYQWRPLGVGERTTVTLRLSSAYEKGTAVELEASDGFAVEADVPGGGTTVWRIRGTAPGRHTMWFHVDGKRFAKELVVGDRFGRVSPLRPRSVWTSQLLYPVETPLSAQEPAETIEIRYPDRESIIYGADYWVLTFFVVSMAVALMCRPVFDVKF